MYETGKRSRPEIFQRSCYRTALLPQRIVGSTSCSVEVSEAVTRTKSSSWLDEGNGEGLRLNSVWEGGYDDHDKREIYQL